MTDTGDIGSPSAPDSQDRPSGLFIAWEHRTRVWALVFAAVTLLVTVPLGVGDRPG